MAVQLRGIAVVLAPWLAQLVGLALICSNSSVRCWRVGLCGAAGTGWCQLVPADQFLSLCQCCRSTSAL
jgi:hypothetical protein